MEWQSKAINYCIAEEHYEFIFSHMHNVDALGHQFWHWRKKRQRWETDPALYERFAEQCYRDTDAYIGSFLHLLDEGWTIFLFSDHGFLTSDEEEPPVLGDPFGINVPVMETLGYTVLKKDSSDPSLAEFLQGLGEDASASADAGTMLTVTEDCNVRASADSEGEVIGGFSAGTEVEKKGQEGDWIQVDYDGQTGYVYSGLLE